MTDVKEIIINESWFDRRHYNAIAKEIREIFPINFVGMDTDLGRQQNHLNAVKCAVLTELALNLAKRFKKDNPNFEPFVFLNHCSPDIDLYPLAELWEEVKNEADHQQSS